MPSGANLTFDFSTTGAQPGANHYYFLTGGDVAPAVSAEFTFDFYSGATAVATGYFGFNYNIFLCEYTEILPNTGSTVIEFSRTCAELALFSGQTASVDMLTTHPFTQVNLPLCSYAPSNQHFPTFEFAGECATNIIYGSDVSIDLWTSGRELGTRVDLSLFCDRPAYSPYTVIFDLGDDVAPVSYVAVASVCAVADLTIDQNLRSNDLSLCYGYKWVKPNGDVDLDTTGSGSDDLVRRVDGFEAYEWVYEFEPLDACYTGALGALFAHDSNIELDLYVLKSVNVDLGLCADEDNPALDYSELDPHNFEFQPSYPYDCSQMECSAYHGARTEVIILKYVEFENVVAFSGHYSDADFTPYMQFSPIVYGGAYADSDLEIFAAWEADFDFYSGALNSADLAAFKVFYDLDAYSGADTGSDLEVPKGVELDIFVYGGELTLFELKTLPVIYAVDGYAGSDGGADLDIKPAIECEADAYSGHFSDADMLATPGFLPVAYQGAYGVVNDMEISPSEGIGFIDPLHGAYADSTLAVTFALYAAGISGAIASFDMATTITLDVDIIGGEYGDLDFSTFGPPLFETDNYHGSNTVADMSVSYALNARAYGGSYGDLELDIAPSENITLDFYTGAIGVADTLTPDVWNFFCYEGAYTDSDLAVQVNFGETLAYHGGYGEEFDFTMAFVAFDVDATYGSYADTDFTIVLGQELGATGYHGALFTAVPTILIHHQFKAHAVHDLAMYDGVQGLGGLNHCYTELTTCASKLPIACEQTGHEDSITRFVFPVSQRWEEYDSDLNINFDDDGFSPFNPCNFAHGSGKMEVDLCTRPRLELDFYSGADTALYMDRELLSFGDVPAHVLYSEHSSGDRHDHRDPEYRTSRFIFDMADGSSVLTWFNEEGDVFAWTGTDIGIELETIAWTNAVGGEEVLLDVFSVAHPEWRSGIERFYHDSKITFDFNPVLYTRFCHGYIVPSGASVVLDFGSSETYDCYEYAGKHGALLEFILEVGPNFESDNRHGHYAQAILTTYGPWLLHAHAGSKMWIPSEPMFEVDFRHGSSTYFGGFEILPILGWAGEHAVLEELVVPGPGVRWITPTGCLENEYVPLTPSGDPDLAALEPDEHGVYYWTGVPVEMKQYFTTLLATCISYGNPDAD